MRKWFLVTVLSILGILIIVTMLYYRLGRRVFHSHKVLQLAPDAEYLAKESRIRPLQMIKGSRPFTPEEMEIIRQTVRDMSDFRLRCRALTALAYVRDERQKQEAIDLAKERLKDPEWVVRQYALWALGNLGARDAIPQILPLLNDPNSTVRDQAKKTLQKLGYQVRE